MTCPRADVMPLHTQAHLGDAVGLAPDYPNNTSITIKLHTWNCWFPSAYKSYVYYTVAY